MSKPDVLIIGAGLAGLSCGRELARRGIAFRILEASDGVGGRVRTDQVDGFLLDRGFQIYLTAYPEGKRTLDLAALDLKPFVRGALIRFEGRFHRVSDPRVEPLAAFRSLFNPIGSPFDKAKLLKLYSKTLESSAHENELDCSTLTELRDAGLSEASINRLFRPFLGGVFLEKDLSTSTRFFRFVFRMFAAGPGAVPARGMQAIPSQLAAALPSGSVQLNAPVLVVDDIGVTLADRQRLTARAVVVATDAIVAATLLNGRIRETAHNSNTTLYYSADRAPLDEAILVLDGDGRGPVNNLVVMSNASPAYAPQGKSLIAASIVGLPEVDAGELDRLARNQLNEWFGSQVDGWKLIRQYRIEYALPSQTPGTLDPWQRDVRLGPGLFVCGDHRDNGSIDGALASGRRTGEAVAEELARE